MHSREKRKLLDLRKKFQSKIISFCLRFSATVITEIELAYVLHVQHEVYPNGLYFDLWKDYW